MSSPLVAEAIVLGSVEPGGLDLQQQGLSAMLLVTFAAVGVMTAGGQPHV